MNTMLHISSTKKKQQTYSQPPLTLFDFLFTLAVVLFIETLAICMPIARTLLSAKPG